MKLKYDPKAKAVYIYLVDTEGLDTFGVVVYTQQLTDDVNVDWMKDGKLFGIEVLCVEREPVVEPY